MTSAYREAVFWFLRERGGGERKRESMRGKGKEGGRGDGGKENE